VPPADSDIEIRQIKPGDKLTGLSLGDKKYHPLKMFLENHALLHHVNDISKTYCAFDLSKSGRVCGYITLMCGEIESNSQLRDVFGPYPYLQFPTIKIARLAVDRRYRGSGLGLGLVQTGLGLAYTDVVPIVGGRFVSVDAKTDAVAFYRKLGFDVIVGDSDGIETENSLYKRVYRWMTLAFCRYNKQDAKDGTDDTVLMFVDMQLIAKTLLSDPS